MRVALLTVQRQLADEPGERAGLSLIAGRSVLARQIDCVRDAGCERVICLVERMTPRLTAIQRETERDGTRFIPITDIGALAGLVDETDIVLVLADGLVPIGGLPRDCMVARNTILTLPERTGVAAGFERIDRDDSWGGVMTVEGGVLNGLARLPPDIDMASSILRLALQTGARRVRYAGSADAILAAPIYFAIDRRGLRDITDAYLLADIRDRQFRPGLAAVADRAANGIIRHVARPSRVFRIVNSFVVAAVCLAIVTAAMVQIAAALAILIIAMFGAGLSRNMARIGRYRYPVDWLPKPFDRSLDFLFDAVVFAVIVVNGQGQVAHAFAAFMLLGLAAVVRHQVHARTLWIIPEVLCDRANIAGTLLVAAIFAAVIAVVHVLAAILLAVLIYQTWRTRDNVGLTMRA